MTVNTVMINMQKLAAGQNKISYAVFASLIGNIPTPYQCLASRHRWDILFCVPKFPVCVLIRNEMSWRKTPE